MASVLSYYGDVSAFKGDSQPTSQVASFAAAYSLPKVEICRRPSEVLLENSSIRPDVANIAILGYN